MSKRQGKAARYPQPQSACPGRFPWGITILSAGEAVVPMTSRDRPPGRRQIGLKVGPNHVHAATGNPLAKSNARCHLQPGRKACADRKLAQLRRAPGVSAGRKFGISGISSQMGLMIKTDATGRPIHCQESRLQWLPTSRATTMAFGSNWNHGQSKEDVAGSNRWFVLSAGRGPTRGAAAFGRAGAFGCAGA